MSGAAQLLEKFLRQKEGAVAECNHNEEKLAVTLGLEKNHDKDKAQCEMCGATLLVHRFPGSGYVSHFEEEFDIKEGIGKATKDSQDLVPGYHGA